MGPSSLSSCSYLLGALKVNLDDLLVDAVVAGRGDVGHVAASVWWQHDSVLDERVLIDHAIHVTPSDPVAHLHAFEQQA